MKKVDMNQKKIEEIRRKYLETKKELKIYKWGHEKSKRGLKILFKDLEKEIVERKKIQKKVIEVAKAEARAKAELEKERLEIKLEEQKELERIRMDFLSLASHQLRTPLSGTKWMIETMNREVLGKVTKKQKEYFDEIYRINEQMIKLVSEMLSSLRLESKEALIKKENVLVSPLFKDILAVVAAAAKKRKIALQGPLNHRTLTIETDSEMLKSILGSFLSNAIDYSMPGQKVILDVKEKSNAIIFSVKDNGIGIPKIEQKRIFERFYRASNAKSLKPNGTGLGISIAKMLAEKIGAEISFESEENKGATFYLRIPKRSSRGVKAKDSKSKI